MTRTPTSKNTSRDPLLFLAIPTHNRASSLERLLLTLEPQLALHPEVSLFVSDNASTDGTQAVLARMNTRGMRFHHHRQPQNLGPDANFLTCFRAATGKYFWLLGDDEVVLPHGLDLILSHLRPANAHEELDLLHLSSSTYRKDPLAEYTPDRWGRQHHTFTQALPFTTVVHIYFTFISANIVNRERLLQLPHEDPAHFLGTNLIQLSWTLPLLQQLRRSRILYERAIASRTDASGGYSIGTVFGRNLSNLCHRLLAERPDLAARITNSAIRRWFPPTIVHRRTPTTHRRDETDTILRPIFGRNYRYWFFLYPAIRLPLPLAKLWVQLALIVNRTADHVRHPFFWRRIT